jgi:hypothetical protein
MPFTLISTYSTLSLAGLVATYTATSHGIGGILFVKYTKGNEDGVRIALSYGSKGLLSTDRYQHISLNSATRILSPTTYILNALGNYRIPITWTIEETYITFTFTQYGSVAATGTLDIDFREAE